MTCPVALAFKNLWLFVALPFLLSFYASLIVSRSFQFHTYRRLAWEIVSSIEHELTVGSRAFQHPWASAQLNFPTQHLRRFGHRKAAAELDAIAKEIESALENAQQRIEAGTSAVTVPRDQWGDRVIAMRPSRWAIIGPWPIRF